MKKAKLFFCFLFLAIAVSLSAQNRQVSGTVTDQSGEPLAGVAVIVDGSRVGTATDANGKYSLNVRGGDALRFSLYGMRDAIVAIGDNSTINVVMEEDTIGLDEAVVTATGMTRQEKTLGYASTTVRSDEIMKGHAPDALSGLSGKVAGVQISNSGGTGTSQKVIIRGFSSLRSNQPLYIVDGVPITNSTSGSFDLNNAIDFGNSGADVNPNDIASITVLKGASATALYGSRASNGVIVITTKRGEQNEDIKVTYEGSVMASNVLRIPNLQQKFGQGWFYSYDGNIFENYSYTENGSWGICWTVARLSGVPVHPGTTMPILLTPHSITRRIHSRTSIPLVLRLPTPSPFRVVANPPVSWHLTAISIPMVSCPATTTTTRDTTSLSVATPPSKTVWLG